MNSKQSKDLELNEQIQNLKSDYLAKKTFHLIKTGKEFKRKNLFKNLFYLSGLGKHYGLVTTTGQKGINSQLFSYCEIRVINNLSEIAQECLKDIFSEYLNLNFFEISKQHSSCWILKVAYSEVNWEKIDLELLLNHSDNIDIYNYYPNIINYKKIPQIIQKIIEEKETQILLKKEEENIQIMIDFLTKKGYFVKKLDQL